MKPEGLSFADQLARSRQGDPRALEELFARWRPLLWLQASRVLGGELSGGVDPSDVVQEALTQAYHDLDQFRGGTEAEWVAWLHKIVAGQAAKIRRHHSAERRSPDREAPLCVELPAPSSGNPADRALDQERAARLAAAIEGLPENMRRLVVLRVFQKQPFEKVAQALEFSPGAARVLWTRTLRRLREILGK